MRRKGQVLLFALLLLGIFSVILGSLGAIWHSRWKAYQVEADGLQAFHIAEAGLEAGRAQILGSGGTSLTGFTQAMAITEPSGVVVNGQFQVTITSANDIYLGQASETIIRYTITSEGTFKSARRAVASSIIKFTNPAGAHPNQLMSELGSWREL
jgi:hypothetical protein